MYFFKNTMIGSGHKFLSKTADKEEQESHLNSVKERYFEPFPLEPSSDTAKIFHDLFEKYVPNSLNRYIFVFLIT